MQLTALGLWLIVVAEGLRRLGRPRTLRFTFVDGAVAVFVAALAVPVFASVRTPKDFATPIFLWLGPYLAARVMLNSTQRLFGFLRLIAVLAMFTVPFVLWEYVSGSNPFTRFAFNPVEASVWAHPQTRFGQTRPAAAFGHPLALSMFLVSASLFCLALWLASRDERRRRWWLTAAAVTFAAQALTLSRTGWIMAAVGVSLLAFIRFGSGAKLRLMGVLGAVALVLVSHSPPCRRNAASSCRSRARDRASSRSTLSTGSRWGRMRFALAYSIWRAIARVRSSSPC